MISIFKRLDAWTLQGARLFAILGLAGVLTLSFAIVIDVLARWLLNAPIAGVRDLSSLFAAIAIAASFPACVAECQHITIRFLGRLMGPKYEALFETFGHLIALAVFSMMAWQLWLYADGLAAEGEVTMILGWPLSPWWRTVSVIMAFCVPVQVCVLIKSANSLVAKNRSGEGPQ